MPTAYLVKTGCICPHYLPQTLLGTNTNPPLRDIVFIRSVWSIEKDNLKIRFPQTPFWGGPHTPLRQRGFITAHLS